MREKQLGHLTESHQIFDRVTMLEANVSSLADSVRSLAGTVQSTDQTVSEIRAMIGTVGKTDGKTILTLGASMVGALGIIGSMFLGPIQRDVAYLDKALAGDESRLEAVSQRHDEYTRRHAEIDGDLKLLDWRLRALENGTAE